MYLRTSIKFMLCALITLCCTTKATAQEDIDDFRKYKFYDDDEELWLPEELPDSIVALEAGYVSNILNPSYNTRAVSLSMRGEKYAEQGNSIEGIAIDQNSARLMRKLGIRSNRYSGISRQRLGITTAGVTEFSALERPYYNYDLQRLGLSFSGRGALGDISHLGIYYPTTDGVRLKSSTLAVSHYARVRTGRDIYVDGLYTNAVDLAANIYLNKRNSTLSVTLLLPWSERATRGYSTAEAFALLGNTLYNPSWGMQGGKMRSANVRRMLHPQAIAIWNRRLSAATELTLSATAEVERGGYTALTWFNASTPLPDNYRYMPSYHTNPVIAKEVTEAWVNNDMRYTQIDWQGLYHTNTLQKSGEAAYALEERRSNTIHSAINVGFESRIRTLTIEYGLLLDYCTTHEFKVMEDLLGADHIIDLDYFLVDDATYGNKLQNNLRDPNRIIGEGDTYGYNYRLTRYDATLYGAARWQYGAMAFNIALQTTLQQSLRRGYFEKEIFAGKGSYGPSQRINLAPYSLAAAWSYAHKEHIVSLSAMLRGSSPEINMLFLQPQYNNRIIDTPTLHTTLATEASYSYTATKFRCAISLFAIAHYNQSKVEHYYDDIAQEYVDAVISGIGRGNFGVEAAAEAIWSRYFSSTFRATAGTYRLLRDAKVTLYGDADNSHVTTSYAQMGDCHDATPHITAYADIVFKAAGWQARMGVNYYGFRYAEPSFIRRTERITSYADSREAFDALCHQERLPDAATIDISLSKRIRFKRGGALYLSLAVNNILGSKIIYRAFEQNRIRRQTILYNIHIEPFANKLNYAYGRTFNLSIGYNF